MNFTDKIPIRELDKFYLDEVVSEMPEPIRYLATDIRLMRSSKVLEQHINTLAECYPNDYLFTPWLLDDIFPVAKEVSLVLGKGYILTIISLVIMDHLVDRQLPDIAVIPLLQQRLMLKANALFNSLFESRHPFWEKYHTCLTEFIDALALESYCLDFHEQPYTFDVMEQVCIGKAAPLRLIAFAMAHLSGNSSRLPAIEFAIDTLLYADQLADDTRDWRDDYLRDRHTLPVHLGLTKSNSKNPSQPSVDNLKMRLESHGILQDMAEKGIRKLEQACDTLSQFGLTDSIWYAYLNDRIHRMQRQVRYFFVISLLNRLNSSLSQV